MQILLFIHLFIIIKSLKKIIKNYKNMQQSTYNYANITIHSFIYLL